MKPSLIGRLDLIRALAQEDPLLRAWAATFLGCREMPVVPPERTPVDRAPSQLKPVLELPPEAPYDPANVHVPFWRLEAYEAVAVAQGESAPGTVISSGPQWRLRPATPPDVIPLAPKQVVLTRLRRVSAIRRPSHEIDVDTVVDRLSRGLWLGKLPYRERRQWGSALYVIVDRARRLVPYWQDQDDVNEMLQEMYPPHSLTITYLGDGESQAVVRWPEERRGQVVPPLPGDMVLVLGDLGCLATSVDHVRRFWLDLGRHLWHRGHPAIALVPARSQEVPPDLARLWTVVEWAIAPSPVTSEMASQPASVADVLTLLAPAIRVEPGLLRTVRGLLPGGRGNPGLEARVWQDGAFVSRHSEAASWHPERRQAYLARFAERPEAHRQAVLEVIRSWRSMLRPAIWFEEILELDAPSQAQLVRTRDLADAKAFLRTWVARTRQSEHGVTAGQEAWFSRLSTRFPETASDDPEIRVLVHELYNQIRPRDMDTAVPRWYDPALIPSSNQRVYPVALWQVGSQLVCKTVDETSASQPLMHYGSPLGVVQTASGEIKISAGYQAPFWQLGTPPAWADRWGHDAYGPWVTFRIGDVEQRLRWIPPGWFWMGSPEDEEGRYDDERPRHEVELSQGFWLFDTPCTQALWEVVMGENPSAFPGANRPVENVGWEDCQVFINKLNEQLPDLGLRLPTEAQWEYACRAGTQGTRYDPDLDAIAWYNANSGGETHDVAQKRPNAWGLYDMLGNVYEWVYDWYGEYTADSVTDLRGPATGADRVFRGGLWDAPARYVRAALRCAYDLGYRGPGIGFRCLSSGSEPARARETWGASEQRAEPAETTPRQPAARLLNVQRQSELATVFPDADWIEVRTDCERLRFGRITRPPWAQAIGRDAYGLWVRFEVNGVRQRLRWIGPGRFWIGSPKDEEGRYEWEGPRHEVELTRGFWLFDTPCTQALWQAVMAENPSVFQGANRPVENLSWADCQTFINQLNGHFPNLGLRLPTETQWEYACRAGTQEPRYDPDLDAIAWYGKNSDYETHDVGQKCPNAWGLYDMLGNVYEWCHDGDRDYESGLAIDPVGPTDAGAARVIRGGRWGSSALHVRAAYRLWHEPGLRNMHVGFRCLSSGVSLVAGMRRARRRAAS